MFVAVMVPYQLTMDAMDRRAVVPIFFIVVGILCEVAFVVDLWFSWHVRESQESMELYDQQLRSVYKKERMLWDILAAIPFYDVLAVLGCSSWFKLLRCIKIFNLGSYFNELNRRSIANETTSFWHVWMGYLLVIYWVACAYLAVSMDAGFGVEWEGWLPSQELVISDPQNPSSSQLALRLLRGLFFAMVTFVKKAYCPEPETASLYAFHIGVSFVGLITMSYVIGELASLFISYIGLEVGFRKNYIAVELYLARLRLSDRLKARTYAFMTSLWSSHAGVNYEELLAEMPRAIRTSCVLQVSTKPLSWFVMKVIAPVCWEESHKMDEFTRSVAERLRFECYPRDESVVTEGSIVRAMYFVIKGHLSMQSRSLLDRSVGLRNGSYFGERGLLGCTISAYTVRTVRACDLLSLSSEAFVQVLQGHLFTRLALKVCERAYKQLKGQPIASNSRTDMEEHWGAALLRVVQAIQAQKHPTAHPTPPVVKEAADKEAGDPPPSSDRIPLSSLRRKVVTRQNSKTTEKQDHLLRNSNKDASNPGEAKGVHNANVKSDELPANVEGMCKALKTAHSCFEALRAQLHQTWGSCKTGEHGMDYYNSDRELLDYIRSDKDLCRRVFPEKHQELPAEDSSRTKRVREAVTMRLQIRSHIATASTSITLAPA
ncbi:hypothetical protein PF004_g7660 [Phytophthora fragariae]|uniref:Cyclic nucleotide-binding domain-containing protein n=1 Tax=Phytophthora fragariae TaxID=53985 RepID=A0A6G0P935_9STRA|nr:hypothetical protein PF004_g7660 [Phytophthora fragariae]